MSQFVLVDCNNFFASCERVFNPHLEKKPLIVLSNHQGAVVARSEEAKKLGIAMGVPFFEIRDLCRRCGVEVFSSNFALYGDISSRIMQILAMISSKMQVYSIDEAFLHLPEDDIRKRCLSMRRLIKKWTGIPVSLGFAPTKTLAKVAASLAKKSHEGVSSVTTDDLRTLPVQEVWGIGKSSKALLASLGIYTAWQLKEADPLLIRKKGGLFLERVMRELQGLSCSSLEEEESSVESITRSRSFGQKVKDLSSLMEAISCYTAAAAESLREQSSSAGAIYVYLETVEFQIKAETKIFPLPLRKTSALMKVASEIVKTLFEEGLIYRKCGVTLMNLSQGKAEERDLFLPEPSKRSRLQDETVDALNHKFGKGTLFYGSMGVERSWRMSNLGQSPAYTTSWEELPRVKA